MDLDQLKLTWQTAGKENKLSEQQIEQMTKIGQHPVLGRIRLKLLVEALAMSALLVVFYDIFDGHTKPAYASVALVMGVVFYLASNVFSYFTLKNAVSSKHIIGSLHHFLMQLQQAKAFSLTSLVLFSISLWVYFTSSLRLDTKLVLVLAGMAGTTLIFLYLSARIWARWIGRIRQSIDELEA